MFKKDKKAKAFETLFSTPKKSRKKRIALISLSTAAALVGIAGIAAQNQDKQ